MLEYIENPKNLDGYTMRDFCDGWKKPLSDEALKKMICQSAYSVIAVQGDEVLGIITALSDNVNFAFIPFLEVRKDHQSKGIGSVLVRKMLALLEDTTCVDLTCDTDVQSFYERFGMLKSHGMIIRRYLEE